MTTRRMMLKGSGLALAGLAAARGGAADRLPPMSAASSPPMAGCCRSRAIRSSATCPSRARGRKRFDALLDVYRALPGEPWRAR